MQCIMTIVLLSLRKVLVLVLEPQVLVLVLVIEPQVLVLVLEDQFTSPCSCSCP